ncbi:GntR family transcriptional regulator [Ihubacter sp. rT4E-8]|uniref:GntR family transcriptional regulator n=1 Tax=unclassified Ihubacter TaxID=2633299 RepID=UPI003C7CF509
MDIIIRNANNQPIYEQIYTQLKNHIISGALKEGDALPSIRGLAKDLKISVITTKRAYDELEQEGFIYTVAGKGCFVAEKNTQLIRENHLRRLEELLEEILELASSLDMDYDALTEMLRLMAEEE